MHLVALRTVRVVLLEACVFIFSRLLFGLRFQIRLYQITEPSIVTLDLKVISYFVVQLDLQ